MDKLQEFINQIKNNNGKLDIKIISEEEQKEKMKKYTEGPIKRIDLQKMPSPQVLTNSKNDLLIFFNSKVFDVTEFSKNVFGNMLGVMLGFTKEGIDFNELPKQIKKNISQ
jgi:cytochrome b involved in lipid metabolism